MAVHQQLGLSIHINSHPEYRKVVGNLLGEHKHFFWHPTSPRAASPCVALICIGGMTKFAQHMCVREFVPAAPVDALRRRRVANRYSFRPQDRWSQPSLGRRVYLFAHMCVQNTGVSGQKDTLFASRKDEVLYQMAEEYIFLDICVCNLWCQWAKRYSFCLQER